MSTKEEVIRLIKNLPDNVTTEEIIKELYTKMKIDKDLQEKQPGVDQPFNAGKWLH